MEDKKMGDCIFCKIANGQIPSNTVYEDDMFRVILDISPANKGHMLVLPKEHADNLFEISEDTFGKGFILAKKMAEALKKAVECEGVNILQNNGLEAGQTVNHLHIHVIPRIKGDKVVIKSESVSVSEDEFKTICDKIKNNL